MRRKMFSVASSTQSVLNGLDGSEMRIPPLEPMVSHWPMGISQYRGRLEVDINDRIDEYISSPSPWSSLTNF